MTTHPLSRPPGRLAPIHRAPTLSTRLFALLFRWKLGKVMSSIPIVFARFPALTWPHLLTLRLTQRLELDATLVQLVSIRVSMVNGCAYCTDLHQAFARAEGHARDKLRAVGDPEAPCFDARERAALRYVDEATRDRRVRDETFESLRDHFDEVQIVQLTWLAAFTGYLNHLAMPLGLENEGFCELLERREVAHEAS